MTLFRSEVGEHRRHTVTVSAADPDAAERGSGLVSACRRDVRARVEIAYTALIHARTRQDRRELLSHLRGVWVEMATELVALHAPAWLVEQLQNRVADRLNAVVTQHLQEEPVAVDRQWLNAQLADAVAHRDVDELERLADYAAAHDDEGTATDIHGKLIKPHRQEWAG